jgi:hypothetical protein
MSAPDRPTVSENPLIRQATAVVERSEQSGVLLRLMGGIAVALHSPSADHRGLQRDYADIDFVSGSADGRKFDELFAEIGYMPDKRFNSLNGQTRRLYFDAEGTRQIDLFVTSFRMCHELPLGSRLEVDSPTIPLAELFLSKAQIVELNHKDTLDLFALLSDHRVGSGDDETLNVDRIAELCAKDWGLWRTVTWTLDRLRAILEANPGELDVPLIDTRIGELIQGIDDAPKSMRWKARARIGDRVQWYELPDDPHRKIG